MQVVGNFQKMEELEHLKDKTNKELYAFIILLIYDHFSTKLTTISNDEFDIEIIKRLKFSNIGDNKLLRSCIDLLEDTEMAMIEFYVNRLQTSNLKNSKLGERYLRLYGIFSIVALQIDAIVGLLELCKVPNKTDLVREIKASKAYEIRNKITAHTISYDDNGKIHAYRITQNDILHNRDTDLVIVSHKSGSEHINIIQILDEFNIQADLMLKIIVKKAIKSLLSDGSKFKNRIINILAITDRNFDYKKLEKSY